MIQNNTKFLMRIKSRKFINLINFHRKICIHNFYKINSNIEKESEMNMILTWTKIKLPFSLNFTLQYSFQLMFQILKLFWV